MCDCMSPLDVDRNEHKRQASSLAGIGEESGDNLFFSKDKNAIVHLCGKHYTVEHKR